MSATTGIVRTDPVGRNVLTVTHPGGALHSWDHEWVRAAIHAIDARKSGRVACACAEILPGSECSGGPHDIDFALGHPAKPGKEGGIVVASYESGGEVLRFLNGAWKVVAHQPPRAMTQ